jgi:uncharacterized protein
MSNDPTPTTAEPRDRTPGRVRVLVDRQPRAAPRRSWLQDDLPYVLPMLAFLLILQVGSTWKSLYAEMYVARTLVVPVLLVLFWRRYTPIRWNGWWLGVIVGVLGIFQWVLMQQWLQHHFALFRPPPADEVFNPFRDVHGGPLAVWGFIAVRVVGAVLVVPVMEELFWRDYLWRQMLAPNDFKLARVGEWGWLPFLGTAAAFALVHGNWWLTAIGWGLMVGALLVYTKSLGACIVAHAVTNLLLAGYVLKTQDWSFW